jgi:histone H3/H4
MAKKSKSKGGKKGEMFLVGSKVKAQLKKAGCNTAGDALMGLNGYVQWLIEQAAKRAKANGRKTVRPHDFVLM